MTDLTTRLREMRNEIAAKANSIGPLVVAHLLHDAESALLELEADNARLIGANLALQARERPSLVVCEFAGWLSETGEDLHEQPNAAIVAIVNRFFDERPGPCPDCGGKGGTAPNGVRYCNCDDLEVA